MTMREALEAIRDYPANGNSDPDVMAEALTTIHATATGALARPTTDRNEYETIVAELETLVDRYTLRTTLEALAGVCDRKADHIETNWQDHSLATVWDRAARKIDRCSNVGSI